MHKTYAAMFRGAVSTVRLFQMPVDELPRRQDRDAPETRRAAQRLVAGADLRGFSGRGACRECVVVGIRTDLFEKGRRFDDNCAAYHQFNTGLYINRGEIGGKLFTAFPVLGDNLGRKDK